MEMYWGALSTIDISQIEALIARNNILKFQLKWTINGPSIFDKMDKELPWIFFLLSLLFLLLLSPFMRWNPLCIGKQSQKYALFYLKFTWSLHGWDHPTNLPLPTMWGGSTKPARLLQYCSFSIGNALVIISYPLSLVWIFSICNNFISTISRIQWYLISIFLDLKWKV